MLRTFDKDDNESTGYEYHSRHDASITFRRAHHLRPSRHFHIGDLLCLVIGQDVATRGKQSLVALFDHLAGRELTPAEHIAYIPFARDALRLQVPQIFVFTKADMPPAELLGEWLRRREREFGEYLKIAPMHTGVDLSQESDCIDGDNATLNRDQRNSS